MCTRDPHKVNITEVNVQYCSATHHLNSPCGKNYNVTAACDYSPKGTVTQGRCVVEIAVTAPFS